MRGAVPYRHQLPLPHRRPQRSRRLRRLQNCHRRQPRAPHLRRPHRALTRRHRHRLHGGLGPAEDDLTRNCVASTFRRHRRRNTTKTPTFRRRALQALRRTPHPHAAQQREAGRDYRRCRSSSPTASAARRPVARRPLALARLAICHRKIVILLPGPPKELKAIFEGNHPAIAASLPPRFLAKRMLRMALIPRVHRRRARCAPYYIKFTDVETTILAGSRRRSNFHFVCVKPTQEDAETSRQRTRRSSSSTRWATTSSPPTESRSKRSSSSCSSMRDLQARGRRESMTGGFTLPAAPQRRLSPNNASRSSPGGGCRLRQRAED